LFGGMASSVLMAASSLLTWTLSQPGIATNIGAMRIASLLLAFATGGFGHTVTRGLQLAGVSMPSLAFGLMQRWVCCFGLIIAAIAELSSLSMLFPPVSLLLPLGRFPALMWLVVAGFSIPKTRIGSANTK